MKQWIYLLWTFVSTSLWGQGGTELYSADLAVSATEFAVGALIPLTENQGYDNQPAFVSAEAIVYAATRNGQTDIRWHNLNTGEKQWRSATPQGSEYSPLQIPGSKELSAIRLDSTGLQRLYRYSSIGESSPFFPDLKIGYQLWVSPNALVCTVLIDDRMDLYWIHPQTQERKSIAKKVGRSLHKIPNTNKISFIQWKGDRAFVCSYDPKTTLQQTLTELPNGIQDILWLPHGQILYGKGSELFGLTPGSPPILLHHFSPKSIQNISRMAISPSGKKIVLVGEEVKN